LSELGEAISRTISPEGSRIFSLRVLFFENGCFIIITEDAIRIGSISVSISSSNKVNTAKVIPSKFDSIFVNTITEKVASMINGICLISFNSKSQLALNDMKAIMGEVMDIVGGHRQREQKRVWS